MSPGDTIKPLPDRGSWLGTTTGGVDDAALPRRRVVGAAGAAAGRRHTPGGRSRRRAAASGGRDRASHHIALRGGPLVGTDRQAVLGLARTRRPRGIHLPG